eukprot:TRINITY_DN97964_c0_g1_i1.p1 TRINITY_DN97964_c0_g1~~TRINITY_DN97964_c0_g1_i1.p1  ORF type:complete len:403 (-),score=101.60 TRINITY_DN97964_c0_g1_i1:110-1270(-)
MAQEGEDEKHDVFIDEEGVMWGEDEYGRYKIDDNVWTMNEIRDHPLFMEDMPRDITENPHLVALQSLLYDGQSAEESAEHFKNQGNEAMKFTGSHVALQNALAYYTKGLEMECKDEKLNSVLHSNRAAVSLKLGEWVKCVEDCRIAIRKNSDNLKAYFRAARASEALSLAKQGLLFCDGALKISPKEPDLLRLQKQLLEMKKKQDASAEEMLAKDRKEAEEKAADDAAVVEFLAMRGASLGPLLFDMAMYKLSSGGRPPAPIVIEDEDGPGIQWPLLLLYDEYNQTDFVKTFDERLCFQEQLRVMFPEDGHIEWDHQNKYELDKLVAYMEYYPKEESSDSTLTEVDLTAPVWQILQEKRIPPCLVFHVMVGGSPAHTVFVKNNTIV